MKTESNENEISDHIYKELRRLAAARMRFERRNHTLQPTALVHEAFIRLAEQPDSIWKDRTRVLGLAARAMRNVLVDYARKRKTDKRGAGAIQVTLDEGLLAGGDNLADVLAIDEALTKMAEFDPRQASVLELHIFGGLTFEEIAEELGLSDRTIKRDWDMARAWMSGELNG